MVFTNVGRNKLRDFLAGQGPNVPSAFAWGTGTSSATVDDTSLGSEISPRTAFASTTTSDREVRFETVLPSTTGNGNTISELGLFDSSVSGSGNLYFRQQFAGIGKTTASDITAEVTLRFVGVD